MPFQIKDLIVHLSPPAGNWVCLLGSNVIISNVAAAPAQHLQQLKADLRDALDEIEAQEQAFAAGQRPRTLAEANEVEQQLQDALEEFRRQKKDLK
jgi:hypothetical protein